MQHTTSRHPVKCALCGRTEEQAGTFPMVVGVGRVCMEDGMRKVTCQVCGAEVKLLTSSRLQGRTLCLADHVKEVEKYRQHLVTSFDEDDDSPTRILEKAYSEAPQGYTLLAVRRARNSTHLWEAEYEKTELFQMRCS